MSLWVINKIDKKLVATIWDKLTANTLKASIFSLQTELNYKTNCFPTYKGNANSPNTHILCGCKYNVWQVISQVISLSACFWRDPVPEAKNRLAPAGVWKPATSQGMWGKLWSSRVYRLGVGKQFPGTPYHLPSYPSFSLSSPLSLCSWHAAPSLAFQQCRLCSAPGPLPMVSAVQNCCLSSCPQGSLSPTSPLPPYLKLYASFISPEHSTTQRHAHEGRLAHKGRLRWKCWAQSGWILDEEWPTVRNEWMHAWMNEWSTT